MQPSIGTVIMAAATQRNTTMPKWEMDYLHRNSQCRGSILLGIRSYQKSKIRIKSYIAFVTVFSVEYFSVSTVCAIVPMLSAILTLPKLLFT